MFQQVLLIGRFVVANPIASDGKKQDMAGVFSACLLLITTAESK